MQIMRTILILVLPILKGCSSDLVQKGCFSTSFVQKYAFYYKINESLPFTEGLAACNNRLTKYMGLQTDPSLPTYNFIYCGNDIAELSSKADSSLCIQCHDDRSQSCGGRDVMSVYKLRDSTPLAVLIATDQGVEMIVNNRSTLRAALGKTSEYRSVDYIYTEDTMISIVESNVTRLIYKYPVMKYIVMEFLYGGSTNFRSLGIDFIHREVYWSRWSDDNIYKAYTKSQTQHLIADLSSYPRYLSVDPYSRVIFFLQYNFPFIFHYDMSSKTITKVLTEQFHLQSCGALAIDAIHKVLYGIVTLIGDSTQYIVRWDYNFTNMRVLFNGPQLTSNITYGTLFDVYNDTAVWVNLADGTYTVHSCRLTPTCLPRNLHQAYHTQTTIYGLKIFHPERQTAGEKQLCSGMNCQHGCKADSLFTAVCTCPEGMKMNTENDACIVIPSTPSTQVRTHALPSTTTYRPTTSTTISSTGFVDQNSISTATDFKNTVKNIEDPTISTSTPLKTISVRFIEDKTVSSALKSTTPQGHDTFTLTSNVKNLENSFGSNNSHHIVIYFTFMNFVLMSLLFVTLIIVILLLIRTYRAPSQEPTVSWQRQNHCEVNHYIPM